MIDRTDHSAAARTRPTRGSTDAIIVHRFAVDLDKDGAFTFDEAIAFFTRDPEGIATVTLSGTYATKLPTIERWRKDGVPAAYEGAGFVPYHVLVDARGDRVQTLSLRSRGAHASAWNDRSIGIATLWRSDLRAPPSELVIGTARALADLLTIYPRAEVIGHDDTLTRAGHPAKGCPGLHFPLGYVIDVARSLIAQD